jgi:hypothetical protein
VLHIQGIGRSESTRQHRVKPVRRDDDHAEVTSGSNHVATV